MLPTWGLMVLLGNPSSGGAVSWPAAAVAARPNRRSLRREEVTPGGAGAARGRVDDCCVQDLPDRGGRDGVPESGRFALDAAVAPAGIFIGQAQHEALECGCRRRPSGVRAAVVPLPGDQFAERGQQSAGGDGEGGGPAATRYQRVEGGDGIGRPAHSAPCHSHACAGWHSRAAAPAVRHPWRCLGTVGPRGRTTTHGRCGRAGTRSSEQHYKSSPPLWRWVLTSSDDFTSPTGGELAGPRLGQPLRGRRTSLPGNARGDTAGLDRLGELGVERLLANLLCERGQILHLRSVAGSVLWRTTAVRRPQPACRGLCAGG